MSGVAHWVLLNWLRWGYQRPRKYALGEGKNNPLVCVALSKSPCRTQEAAARITEFSFAHSAREGTLTYLTPALCLYGR